MLDPIRRLLTLSDVRELTQQPFLKKKKRKKKKQSIKNKQTVSPTDISQGTQSPFLSHLAYLRIFSPITVIFLLYLLFLCRTEEELRDVSRLEKGQDQ